MKRDLPDGGPGEGATVTAVRSPVAAALSVTHGERRRHSSPIRRIDIHAILPYRAGL